MKENFIVSSGETGFRLVVRDGKTIQHYGVRGMKWGVRRDLKRAQAARKEARTMGELAREFEKDPVGNAGSTYQKLADRSQAKFKKGSEEEAKYFQEMANLSRKKAAQAREKGDTKKADSYEREAKQLDNLVKDTLADANEGGKTYAALAKRKRETSEKISKELASEYRSAEQQLLRKAEKFEARAEAGQAKIKARQEAAAASKPKPMTDAEIRQTIQRMELERRLSTLQKQQKTDSVPPIISAVIGSVGKGTQEGIKNFTSKTVEAALGDLLKDLGG